MPQYNDHQWSTQLVMTPLLSGIPRGTLSRYLRTVKHILMDVH